MPRFRLGSLDHVHVVVPDRDAAYAWYRKELGFKAVPALRRWSRIDGGPPATTARVFASR